MLQMFVLILGETGMRCEPEALHLQWSDISLDAGNITVVSGRDDHRTKSGKSRIMPMTARLKKALQAHAAKYRFAAYDDGRSVHVIHHTVTRRTYQAGARVGTLRGSFNKAATRAKIAKEFRQHDLRHRRVTTWLADGKSPVLVMRAMGHSDLKVTMHYYRFLPDHLRSLVEDAPPQPGRVPARDERVVVGLQP